MGMKRFFKWLAAIVLLLVAALFFFKRGYSNDVITDFDAKGGEGNQDFIEIMAGTKFDIEKDGRNTVVDFGKGSTITLLDVRASQVTDADFMILAP